MPLILLFFEILVFAFFVGQFGFGWTFLGYLFPSILGLFLLSILNKEPLLRLQKSMTEGQTPQKEILNMAGKAIGALLLIIPGFTTRVLGLILIFPLTRWLIMAVSSVWILKRFSKPGAAFFQFGNGAFRVYTQNQKPRGPRQNFEDLSEDAVRFRDVSEAHEVIDVVPLKIENKKSDESI